MSFFSPQKKVQLNPLFANNDEDLSESQVSEIKIKYEDDMGSYCMEQLIGGSSLSSFRNL
eukprot:CAMPEP_0170541318 /NCGR_PEP_ID=MMETSP0211-20121228/1080_1 /TAXON_ID=311385 /ORGANISM="Pseudokeronopsis sp., Strain OXSARD2" /LENGTH=59 /DNA_ID=CAMNT_0010843993 /DNA_START=1534 /DNA_END=1713 /DNA_ORIENTATION=-